MLEKVIGQIHQTMRSAISEEVRKKVDTVLPLATKYGAFIGLCIGVLSTKSQKSSKNGLGTFVCDTVQILYF